MVSSKITNQEVINLGKAIISELSMEIDCNTPARWLVHYIAENIHKSENCQGEEKDAAERKCVDAVFKLWHHRSDLPRGMNPFTEFDSAFRGLSRLDPSNEKPYYNEFSQFNHEIDNNESPESMQWVDIAIYIDKAAKKLVSESFEAAANTALTENAKKILRISPKDSGNDIQIMLDLMYDEEPTNLADKEAKRIESKLKSIEALKNICDIFIEKNNLELSQLKEK